MQSFYAIGDLNVFRDGTLQNMSQKLKRHAGSTKGPYKNVMTRKKMYLVHRLVAEGFKKRHRSLNIVDHVAGKDNYAENIRWSNSKLNSINNTQLGVRFTGTSWAATFRGVHLGSFKNSRDAILAVQDAKRIAFAAEYKRVTGGFPEDTRMSFEYPPFHISPTLLSNAGNDLKNTHENVELGCFKNKNIR